MAILVTGGTGYIGSHTVVELLNEGKDVVIIDNLTNSKQEVLNRITDITGKTARFYEGDIRDTEVLRSIFSENDVEAVIHFAGLKAVGESVEKPLKYYENNVGGTITLCQVMNEFNVKNIVFSSSATVYGMAETMPLSEDMPLSATNPYGRSKLMVEEVLHDLYVADNSWSIALLRYFNPVGAHESGLIGEDPNGIPNNLMPFIAQVATGKLKELKVFGSDYPTLDGTGVRDYIHVVDLAKGHLKAVEKVTEMTGAEAYNLGTGNGFSVLQMREAFEKASGQEIPYTLADRRPGDVATSYADPNKAKEQLNWEAEKGIDEMCVDTWRWQKQNPNGY
ncbi:UDP-glucose 4-epimerase GalE [Salirhabdus salicampi]|uniref:UDP-glucose 4-epimerase GalE n=1 Tax=Salirhabdus salicampi TaxID=476102 RepID=UPI0020C59535|nr:UDP-glucose 4-epimerase GalE [Salirhabdus salicampi]MCP8617507.1 UDP-glucose 4-epimerase GalE [Salirhabdus salicampi]